MGVSSLLLCESGVPHSGCRSALVESVFTAESSHWPVAVNSFPCQYSSSKRTLTPSAGVRTEQEAAQDPRGSETFPPGALVSPATELSRRGLLGFSEHMVLCSGEL